MRSKISKETKSDLKSEFQDDDDFSFEEPVPVIEATSTHEQSIEEEEKSLINALSFTKKNKAPNIQLSPIQAQLNKQCNLLFIKRTSLLQTGIKNAKKKQKISKWT